MQTETVVNGARYRVLALRREDVHPGMLVRARYSRAAFRVVCEDEGDHVLRNLRHPHLVELADPERVAELYWRIEPAPEGGAPC